MEMQAMHTTPIDYVPLCLITADALYCGSTRWPIVLDFYVLMCLGVFIRVNYWEGYDTVGINLIGCYPDL